MGKQYFISGIDTDCGKTYVTGHLAKALSVQGHRVMTTKLVQTGCIGISEDIIEHRRIMGIELLEEDKALKTCPVVLPYPASPHLAAEKNPIDVQSIQEKFDVLTQEYDIVLTEGAGGLRVPITSVYLITDYIKAYQLPVILVSSSKLGSINHTLLSIDYCLQNDINIHAVYYNELPDCDMVISQDSYEYFQKYCEERGILFTAEFNYDLLTSF